MTAATASQDWVSQSIARLEQLEAERQQLAAYGQTDRLAEVDEEIASLYEVLESVADEAEQAPAPAAFVPQASPPSAAPMNAYPQQVQQSYAAPQYAAPQYQEPQYAAPQYAAPQYQEPQYAAPQYAEPAGYVAAPVVQAPVYDFAGSGSLQIAGSFSKSKAPLIAVAAMLFAGVAAAGVFIMSGEKEARATAEPTGPATVISSSNIPDDTQEPKAAKGADVSETPGTVIKETAQPDPRPRHGTSSSSRPRSSSSRHESASDGRELKFDAKAKDPLSGV